MPSDLDTSSTVQRPEEAPASSNLLKSSDTSDIGSKDDFTIIDETIMAEAGKVRLVPHQHPGRLLLLRVRENEFYLVWEDEDKSSRISLEDVHNMIPDEDSSTLLLLTRQTGTWLFHFLSSSPESFLTKMQKTGQKKDIFPDRIEPGQAEDEVSFQEDPGFRILSSFAKVKRFYTRTACKVLGIQGEEKSRKRGGGGGGERPPKNPWIADRQLQLPPSRRLKTPVSALIWASFHEKDGSLINDNGALRQLLHLSGASDEVRAVAWRMMFGLRPAEMNDTAWQVHFEELQGEFQRILEILDFMDVPAEVRLRIDKDVFRTDRTLAFFHPNPGTIEEDLKLDNLRKLQQILLAYYAHDPELEYVQGMADLLSPILYVVRDETEAFWMFAAMMKRQRENFAVNGTAIQRKMLQIQELVRLLDPQFFDYLGFNMDTSQFFFCYRWLLVLFKREFASFEDTLVLWETIMSAPDSIDSVSAVEVRVPYEIYIAAAILHLAKDSVMAECDGLGETLAHLAVFTRSITPSVVLDRADQISNLISSDKKLSWLYTNAIKSCEN